MLTELRRNIDLVIVILVAVVAYHLYLKATGRKRGVAA